MLWRRTTGWPAWAWASPFDELDRMRRQMDILTETFSTGLPGEPIAGVFPLVNVTEDKENYYVRAELPGIKADELDISVTGDTLSLTGERRLPAEEEKAQYHRREREAGSFSRIITLPSQIDAAKANASCTDGILTIVLPRSEQAKPKQITVKTS
ncbi:MAG: Hsp20/alpha crystallin family protein [Deltaproteobacteria bacterium]|nr:Hsp20/alpha crystallin family protein [Deltaproteobacteria bacterium]